MYSLQHCLKLLCNRDMNNQNNQNILPSVFEVALFLSIQSVVLVFQLLQYTFVRISRCIITKVRPTNSNIVIVSRVKTCAILLDSFYYYTIVQIKIRINRIYMTYLASPDIDLHSNVCNWIILSIPFYADRSQRYLLSRSLRYKLKTIS